MRHVDVAVVGGGPAGGTAARLLAAWGHTVLLADREGGRAPLAESLPPSCGPLLDATGLREAVEQAGFVRATGNTVWWAGGERRVEPFPGGATGFQVLSTHLDATIRQAAAAAGATIRRPATVTRVTAVEGDHEVELATPDGAAVVRATWVLDASGRAGLLARARRAPGPLRTLAVVAAWERDGGWDLPDETHTLVESVAWGWGWSVPVAPGRRYVTVMLDPAATPLASGPDLAARYHDLLAALPALGRLVDGARLVTSPWACDATPYAGDPVPMPGVLAIGDAASGIDPLSSFGVKKALASAWLAAVTVHTSLTTPAQAAAALALFASRERAYVDAATRGLAVLSREAAGAAPGAFWSVRGDLATGDEAHDVARLREAPDVVAAFQSLRSREQVRLVRHPALVTEDAPLVRDTLVVLEPHLRLRGIEAPVRYLRHVDLLALLDIATQHADVGRILATYGARHPAVPLPDLLGALSVLVARGALDFA